MKTKVFLSVTVLVLLVGLVFASAEARGWHRGFGHRGWRHGPVGFVAKELDLSDTQRQQIGTIWEGERPALSNLAKQFADQNRDLSPRLRRARSTKPKRQGSRDSRALHSLS